jgi:hypothetical protein
MSHKLPRAIATFFLLLSSCVFAQSAPPQHPPRPKILGPANWEPTPQEVSAAYWTLESGWNTDLEMRNNLRHRELTITPVLRAADGRKLPSPRSQSLLNTWYRWTCGSCPKPTPKF